MSLFWHITAFAAAPHLDPQPLALNAHRVLNPVYTFSSQWLELEQSVRTPEQMEAARRELTINGSNRIAASDRVLNTKIF